MYEKLTDDSDLEKILKQAVFDTVKFREPYPDYPTIRLTIEHPEVAQQLAEGRISALPDGPWNAGFEHLKPQTTEELRLLQLEGYDFDDTGRPLHPWLIDMMCDPEVGVVTGTGKYWKMGPNKTADPIVVTNEETPHILLVLRSDNNLWAFPGGFIDPGEDGIQAGARENFEETGLVLSGEPEKIIYDGVVADARTTTYAWAETVATLWRIDEQAPLSPDYNEVKDARWFPITNLPSRLHGSHGALLNQVINSELS